jgi:hypothetical protein
MDFEAYARQAGFEPAALSESQRAALLGAWKYDIVADADPDLRAAELAELRARRPRAPELLTMDHHHPGSAAALEAGLLVGRGVPLSLVADWYGERTAEAASHAPLRNLTLHGVMRSILAAHGRHAPPGRFSDSEIRTVFEVGDIRAAGGGGPSTMSLPNILSAVAGKLLLQGFESTGTTWDRWCTTNSVNDFKQVTRLRLTGSGQMTKVPPGGEIKAISGQEEVYTNIADTRAALIGIDRRMLVNDDLSALDGFGKVLGRQAALSIERDVYTYLLQNASTIFTSGRANLITGAGSVLADAGLTSAVQKLREQKDANGDPVLLEPRVLLVPPALEETAKKLANSTSFIGAPTTPVPGGNVWQGMFTTVVSPFIGVAGAPSGTSGSDTAWFIMAAPGDFSPVEVVFLNGQRAPTVETGDLDFNMLGIALRAYIDYGVGSLDYRGAVKSAGA